MLWSYADWKLRPTKIKQICCLSTVFLDLIKEDFLLIPRQRTFFTSDKLACMCVLVYVVCLWDYVSGYSWYLRLKNPRDDLYWPHVMRKEHEGYRGGLWPWHCTYSSVTVCLLASLFAEEMFWFTSAWRGTEDRGLVVICERGQCSAKAGNVVTQLKWFRVPWV